MSPEERQLITGLFDRMRPAASQQRDRDAEGLIAEQVRTQPYAPYLLAQTVIVQDQALQAANQKIQALEEEVRKQQTGGAQPQEPGFLGGLGRSIFGAPDQGRGSVPATGARGYAPQADPRAQGYGAQPQAPQGGGPWGQAASAAGGMFGGGGGGGFMKGALGAAAGVAGGVLLADGIKGLFSGGHNPYGIASGFGGGAEGFGNPGGETIVNNYYDSPEQGQDLSDSQGGDVGGGDNFDPGSYGGGYSSDV